MNSVERVMAALNHQIPDKVPYAYGYIHPKVREAILGEKIQGCGRSTGLPCLRRERSAAT